MVTMAPRARTKPVLNAFAIPNRVPGCVLGFDGVTATRFTPSAAAIVRTWSGEGVVRGLAHAIHPGDNPGANRWFL